MQEIELLIHIFIKQNKNNTSGIRGVHFDKDRGLWVAQIMFQRKAHNLGRFKTKSEAVKTRLTGEEKYFGKYRQNYRYNLHLMQGSQNQQRGCKKKQGVASASKLVFIAILERHV